MYMPDKFFTCKKRESRLYSGIEKGVALMTTERIWLFCGCLMILSEFIMPGFIIFFFGAGAVVTAAAVAFFPLSVSWQFAVFLISSLVLLFTLRRFLPKVFSGREKESSLPDEETEFAGESAVVSEEIAPGKPGKIIFHGSVWQAESDTCCAPGKTVKIVCRKNLTFTVKE